MALKQQDTSSGDRPNADLKEILGPSEGLLAGLKHPLKHYSQ